jgi:hypothetical protein
MSEKKQSEPVKQEEKTTSQKQEKPTFYVPSLKKTVQADNAREAVKLAKKANKDKEEK